MKRSQIKAKPKKFQKASVPEEKLQDFADSLAYEMGFNTNHIPQKVYHFLISDSLTIDEEIKAFMKKQFFGRPDNELRKNIKGTNYQLVYQSELKTDSKDAKLTKAQKIYTRGKNFEVLNNFKEIEGAFKKFELFLSND